MANFYQHPASAKSGAGKVKADAAKLKPDLKALPSAQAKEVSSKSSKVETKPQPALRLVKDNETEQTTQPGPRTRSRIPTRLRFGFFDYIWISLFWMGISYLWGGVNGVILPKLNQQLVDENYKGTTLGVITALGMIVAIIVQPAAGALSDLNRHHWGRRRPYILLGGVLAIVSLFLLAAVSAFLHSWWFLLGAYLLLQFADNIAQGAYQGFIPDNVPEGKRGRASGAMGVAQIVGNVGGLAVATFFIDQHQPGLAIMVICLVFIAMLVPTLFLVHEEPLTDTPAKHHTSGFNLIRLFAELRHYPDFVRFIVSRLFVLTALATITVFAFYFLQDVLGQAEGMLGQSYTMLGLVVVGFSLLSIFPAVWLSDRIGRKKLVIISCSVGVVGMVLLSTAHTMTEVMLYSSLLGIATGSFNSIDWALATDLIPKEAAGRFMGISNLAGAGSQALAALLGGSLRDGFNALGETFLHTKNLGYNALFLCGAVYFLLGIYFLLKVKEPQHRDEG